MVVGVARWRGKPVAPTLKFYGGKSMATEPSWNILQDRIGRVVTLRRMIDKVASELKDIVVFLDDCDYKNIEPSDD